MTEAIEKGLKKIGVTVSKPVLAVLCIVNSKNRRLLHLNRHHNLYFSTFDGAYKNRVKV